MLVNAGKFSAGRFGGGRFTSGKFGQRAGGGGPSAADVAAIMATRDGFWPQGVDPAGPGGLFTDVAASTPATVGQTIACALDRSRGAGYASGVFTGLGAELSPNVGNPFTVTTGVSYVTAAGSIVGNNLRIVASAAFGRGTWTLSGVGVGTFHEIIVRAQEVSGTTARVWNNSGWAAASVVDLTGPMQTVRYFTTATSAAPTIIAYANATGGVSGDTVDVETVSIRPLPGNHALQPTALSRLTLAQTGGIWNLTNDGGDTLPDTLPTGTYTRVWVNTAGTVTTDTGLSGGAVDLITTGMNNVVDVLWATSLTGDDLATVQAYMGGLV
jgi:hypothetical protein